VINEEKTGGESSFPRALTRMKRGTREGGDFGGILPQKKKLGTSVSKRKAFLDQKPGLGRGGLTNQSRAKRGDFSFLGEWCNGRKGGVRKKHQDEGRTFRQGGTSPTKGEGGRREEVSEKGERSSA